MNVGQVAQDTTSSMQLSKLLSKNIDQSNVDFSN